ncbi:ABC transporter ATP-binding protein [Paenibacillus sp. MMS20-IR301]|uniref:ABC transporter ATP-binding protein n=1 Tax=Paenibacillus sp. MMS20-IR301 TaxID=2895946 RepID=UPI0028EB5278|nr:ABC transporter ATP-binding protein [Paenibacillus sp. MMS20-IR301]WNS43332.1 ABC transporter ATP-binding protein [Paenibacillus sp. MMS20-IR301]
MMSTGNQLEAAAVQPEATLELSHVSKVFRGGQGVHDVSFTLEPQVIHGLIGANGSGKSTLLSLIAGQRLPDKGLITYGGGQIQHQAAALQQICLIKTSERSWSNYSLKEIFSFASILFPRWDGQLARELLDRFQLNSRKNYQQLSRGGQSMAGIIVGLASRAPLTLLDEPVTGLDASMREIFYRTLLEDYSSAPRTFVVTTHLIEEAENLFEQMIYLRRGRVDFQGPVEEFAPGASYASGPATVLEKLLTDARLLHSERLGGKLLLALEQLSDPAERRMLQDQGVELSPVPLQKLFVYLTLRDAANTQGGGKR